MPRLASDSFWEPGLAADTEDAEGKRKQKGSCDELNSV
jgi:hypothetical protein